MGNVTAHTATQVQALRHAAGTVWRGDATAELTKAYADDGGTVQVWVITTGTPAVAHVEATIITEADEVYMAADPGDCGSCGSCPDYERCSPDVTTKWRD